jgi:hypothetical protein
MSLSYQQSGLVLKKGGQGLTRPQILDFQRDLRRLGYLRSGIDGAFGNGTERAIMALQHDLMHNDGSGNDGKSPVRMMDYNRGRVDGVTGTADQAVVECMAEMLGDQRFPMLPFADDPAAENRKIITQIASLSSQEVPVSFLMAVLKQETDFKHYYEPADKDQDNFIVVGTDHGDRKRSYVITSRGYGVGQYTLFHHPAHPWEIEDFMLDAGKNLQKAMRLLREKYNSFIIGPADQASDRLAEAGPGPLKVCKFTPADARYLKDCRQCLQNAGMQEIKEGVTLLYEGAKDTYLPTQYYPSANYQEVPVRKMIGCDWPYAVRRYNGSGVNSFHYQVRILKHLLTLPG